MSEKFQVVLAASAERDLDRLPPLTAADVRRFVNGPLRRDPYRAGAPLGSPADQDRRKPPPTSTTMYEASEHSWRLLYRVDANTRTVQVMVVGHRPRPVRKLTDPRPPLPFGSRRH